MAEHVIPNDHKTLLQEILRQLILANDPDAVCIAATEPDIVVEPESTIGK